MSSWLQVQASTFAGDIDRLILLIAVIVGVWFVLAEAVFIGLIFKFRAKPGQRAQYISGELASEKKWVSYPHYAVLVFDVIIVLAALRVWNNVKVSEPTPDETVRVISQQWSWTFEHPGPDGKLDTADDIRTVDDLNVQVDRTYRFELHSKDVLHSFSVPVFRLKQDAVPGRIITGWFRPSRVGDYDIQCAEICGIGHGLMPGRIHVRSSADHQAWLSKAATPQLASAETPTPAPAQPAGGVQ